MPPLPDNLLPYVTHGREERNIECKERLEWQPRRAHGRAVVTADQARIIKSVMAMANIRRGGVIVIGVRDTDGEPVGLDEDTASRFTQDGVSALVNEYAAPYCELTLTVGHLPDDDTKWFVVIEVEELASQPIICCRDGSNGLENGAIFVRGRRIYETARVRSEAEMREILDLAIEKRIGQIDERVDHRLDDLVRRLGPRVEAPAEQADLRRYDEQRGPL